MAQKVLGVYVDQGSWSLSYPTGPSTLVPLPLKFGGSNFFHHFFTFCSTDFDNFLTVGRACEHLHLCKKLPKSDEWILFYMDFKLWPTLTSDACSFSFRDAIFVKFHMWTKVQGPYHTPPGHRPWPPSPLKFGGSNFFHLFFIFFFKQKTAYEIMPSLVGSEMCIRDRWRCLQALPTLRKLSKSDKTL